MYLFFATQILKVLNGAVYPNSISIDHTLISITFGSQRFGWQLSNPKLFQTTSQGRWASLCVVHEVSAKGNSLCYCAIGKEKALLFVRLRWRWACNTLKDPSPWVPFYKVNDHLDSRLKALSHYGGFACSKSLPTLNAVKGGKKFNKVP